MIIDLVFAVIIILAVIKGYQRGLIVGLFSLIAVIIGIAAAMKLSTVVAKKIGETGKVAEEWLPLLSFALVFLVIVLLIRLGAKAIEKTVEVAMLGWVNRICGMFLFAIIYTVVFSVVLFYAEQMALIGADTLQHSVTYPHIQPWGPKVIDGFGAVIPLFRNMFAELEHFFGGVADNL